MFIQTDVHPNLPSDMANQSMLLDSDGLSYEWPNLHEPAKRVAPVGEYV